MYKLDIHMHGIFLSFLSYYIIVIWFLRNTNKNTCKSNMIQQNQPKFLQNYYLISLHFLLLLSGYTEHHHHHLDNDEYKQISINEF